MSKQIKIGLVFPAFLLSLILLPVQSFSEDHFVAVGSSIGEVLDMAQSGDRVLLECGTFWEQGLTIPAGVSLGVWAGEPGCVVIISDGTAPILIFEEFGMDSRIEGIRFTLDSEATDLQVQRGGGVFCVNSSPTFEACTFEGLYGVYGGAVYCRESASPKFENCIFINNRALVIGGVAACVSGSHPEFFRCLITNNSASAGGGAFNAASNSNIILDHCTMDNNGGVEDFWWTSDFESGCWDDSSPYLISSILPGAPAPEVWLGDLNSRITVFCSNLSGYQPEGGLPLHPASTTVTGFDPQFCTDETGTPTYFLQDTSPCSIEALPECGGQGVYPVGCSDVTAVEDSSADQSGIPAISRLSAVYPNPFNPRTTIQFELSQAGPVKISVFDLAGRLVRDLVNENREAGFHECSWSGDSRDGRPVSAGVYFIRMQVPSTVETKRIILVK
jgi:hypothetical protein